MLFQSQSTCCYKTLSALHFFFCSIISTTMVLCLYIMWELIQRKIRWSWSKCYIVLFKSRVQQHTVPVCCSSHPPLNNNDGKGPSTAASPEEAREEPKVNRSNYRQQEIWLDQTNLLVYLSYSHTQTSRLKFCVALMWAINSFVKAINSTRRSFGL